MSSFVDTNLFVRLLTRDDPVKARASFDLFARARRGEVDLHTSEAIVGEILFVLSSPRLFRQPRPEIARALRPVLENRGLRLDYKQSVLAAVDRWAQSRLDYADCVAIEHALREDNGSIYSYDEDFDGIVGIARLSPIGTAPNQS